MEPDDPNSAVTSATLVRAINGDAVWVEALTAQRTGVALIDSRGGLRAVSSSFAEMARRPRAALIGETLVGLQAEPGLLQAVSAIAGGRPGAVFRSRPLEAEQALFGGTIAVEWTLSRVEAVDSAEAMALLLVQDVSARNRLVDNARCRAGEIESLLDNLPGSVYRARADWSIETMHGAAAMTGYAVAEINALAGHFRDLIHPDDLPYVLREASALPVDGAVLVQRYRVVRRDGRVIPVEDRRRRLPGDPQRRVEGILVDISGQVGEQDRPGDSACQLKRILETSLDGYLLIGPDERILDVNDAYCRLSGYSRAELLALRVADLRAAESGAESEAHFAATKECSVERFEARHRRKDGSVWPTETSIALADQASGRRHAFVRDISARRQSEQLLEARAVLGELVLGGDIDSLVQQSLDRAEEMTGSEIAFFHLVDADGRTLTLQAWSSRTLSTMCTAEGKGRHHSIDRAGIWADCIAAAQPQICNDYSGHPGRRGTPDGHPQIRRFVSVPIIRHGRVAAVIGVGNKATDYAGHDVFLVEQFAGVACDGIERIRAQERIATTEATLRLAQRVAQLGSAEVDLASGEISWSPEIRALLGVPADTALDRQYFFARIAAGFRGAVELAWQQLASGMSFDLECRMVAPIERRDPFIWAHQRGEIVRWDGARPLRAVITLQDITDHKQAQEQISRLSHFDPLTTLPNRALFNLRYRHVLDKAARRNRRVALLVLGIDLFKHVNEAMGHGVGDQLLVHVAERLRQRLRGEDLIARLGGDEFAILIDEIDDPAAAGRIAGDLIDALEPPVTVSAEIELSVSVSIGIAVFPEDAHEPESLLSAADAALHHAKSQGRKTFRFYKESLTKAALQRIKLESRLNKALARQEFLLHYQPLWAGEPLRPIGAEALIRWQDSEDGLVLPGRFITVAEDSGLIVPLGRWVLETACRQMRAWLDDGRTLETIAVNVSARQFALSDFVGDVGKALAAAKLPAQYLELEITESVLLDGSDTVMKTLLQLHELGVRLAVDDFGTGYSSLLYLKRYPIDKLKIDRSFVRDIPGDTSDAEIVGAIVAMGRALKLTVLAEGVERETQYKFLDSLGCDVYQGFYFSRPVLPECFPWFWDGAERGIVTSPSGVSA